MMLRKILSLYVSVILLCPTVVMAADIEPSPDYVVLPVEAGDLVPFDGVLLSLDAAAKIVTEKKFEDAECDLRIGYELHIQEEKYQLQLDYKDIEITSWKDKYESMMILKVAENDRLTDLVLKQKPGQGPFLVALGFGIGTLTSLSTEIVK